MRGDLGLPRRDVRLPGGYRGIVTRIVNGRLYVKVAHLAPDYEFGPLDVLDASLFPNGQLVATSHTHSNPEGGSTGAAVVNVPRRPWAVGDRVLLIAVDGRTDDFVVLGRTVP